MNPKWLRSLAWSVIFAALAYLVAVIWAGHESVSAAMRKVGMETLAGLLLLSMINYALRFLRWHWYLRLLGASVRWSHNLRIYIGGFALTTTPGKLGELARTVWLQPYRVPTRSSVAAFIAERFQDFLAILLLSCFGLSLRPGGRWLLLLGALLVCVALSIVMVPAFSSGVLRWVRARGGRLATLGTRFGEVLDSARGCLTPARLAAGLLVGLAAWGAEAFAFELLLRALGTPLQLQTAVSIYAFSMLAGAISSLPGGLGGSEATMIALLCLCGVPLPVAISATVLIRLTTLWFAVLLGVVALAVRVPPNPAAAAAES